MYITIIYTIPYIMQEYDRKSIYLKTLSSLIIYKIELRELKDYFIYNANLPKKVFKEDMRIF